LLSDIDLKKDNEDYRLIYWKLNLLANQTSMAEVISVAIPKIDDIILGKCVV